MYFYDINNGKMNVKINGKAFKRLEDVQPLRAKTSKKIVNNNKNVVKYMHMEKNVNNNKENNNMNVDM